MKTFSAKMLFLAFTIVFTCLLSSSTQAQRNNGSSTFQNYITLQPNVGITEYFGDLNPENVYNKNPKLGLGLSFGYQLTYFAALRGQVLSTKLYSSSDVWKKTLDSKAWDLSGQVVIELLELAKRNPNRIVNLYLFGGMGYIHMNSTVNNFDGGMFDSQKNTGLIFPVGGGMSFHLAPTFDLNLEYGQHVSARDSEMDFISYYQKYDQFSYVSVGVTYKLLLSEFK